MPREPDQKLDQVLPFPRSARFRFPLFELTVPTAQQVVDELQLTSERKSLPRGVGTRVQCEPFQWSTRLCVPPKVPTLPTAQQFRVDEQSTP
jgi:hypothetical protein